MGHAIFITLHILAFLFGFFGLFFTIPGHLIYAIIVKNAQDKKKEEVIDTKE